MTKEFKNDFHLFSSVCVCVCVCVCVYIYIYIGKHISISNGMVLKSQSCTNFVPREELFYRKLLSLNNSRNPSLLLNLKPHYRLPNCPPNVSFLRQNFSIKSYFCRNYINIILLDVRLPPQFK